MIQDGSPWLGVSGISTPTAWMESLWFFSRNTTTAKCKMLTHNGWLFISSKTNTDQLIRPGPGASVNAYGLISLNNNYFAGSNCRVPQRYGRLF